MQKLFFLFVGSIWILPLMSFAGLADGVIAVSSSPDQRDVNLINLACGVELDIRELKTEPFLAAKAENRGEGAYLVHFVGPIYASQRQALLEKGVFIEGYLPNYTYIVRMDGTVKEQVSLLPFVNWIGNYESNYKISSEINLTNQVPEKFVLILFAGIDIGIIEPQVESLGGKVLAFEKSEWGSIVHILLPGDKIRDLSVSSPIKWIEPFHEDYVMNGPAQWVIQTWKKEDRRLWDKGLKGEGQILASLDSGILPSHNFFRDPVLPITDFGNYPEHRKIIGYQKAWTEDPGGDIYFGDHIGHGTHTAGSLTGNDDPVGAESANIGMAPLSKIFFLDGGGSGYSIYTNPDLEKSLAIAYDGNEAGGARIISNSWGSQITRAYDYKCSSADRTMWSRPDYLVMFSCGNTDRGAYTGSPGNAKNVISVGCCEDGEGAVNTGNVSSQGPAGDGRIRPDVVAPGINIVSSVHYDDDYEEAYSGSSMACPVAAGNTVLIRQYLVDGYYPSGTPQESQKIIPSAALLKAMLINSVETDFTSYPVPSPKVGWGRPNLDNVLYFPEDTRKLEILEYVQGLETGQSYEAAVNIDNDNEPFRVTLVWTDYPGEVSANPALVNDLNLTVISPSGNIYHGNNFSNNFSIQSTNVDTLNPVENVFLGSPQTGEWAIKIDAVNVPQGPQPFAVVVTGGIKAKPTGTVNVSGHKQPLNLEVESSRTVRFTLSRPSLVKLELWDATGRLVKTLYEGNASSGTTEVSINKSLLASGSYFITLKTDGATRTVKTIILR